MRSVFLLCCLLAAVACTKDSLEQPSASGARIVGSPALEYALQGVLSVQLTAEMAQAVARAQGETAATRGAAPTRSGVESIDNLLAEIGADRFRRVVDYNPDWESIYDRTGMNRWYRISFDPETDLARVGQRFAVVFQKVCLGRSLQILQICKYSDSCFQIHTPRCVDLIFVL